MGVRAQVGVALVMAAICHWFAATTDARQSDLDARIVTLVASISPLRPQAPALCIVRVVL